MNMRNNTANSTTLTPANSVLVLTYVDNAPRTKSDAQNATARDTLLVVTHENQCDR